MDGFRKFTNSEVHNKVRCGNVQTYLYHLLIYHILLEASLAFNEWTNSKPKLIFESDFSSHKNKRLFLHPETVFVPITKQRGVDLISCYCSGKS